MVTDVQRVLISTLREPERARGLTPAGWTGLVALARSANLLGALAERLAEAGVEVPREPARHLDGARQLSERQRLSVAWEAQALQDALGSLGVPVLLLKGAAYVMAYPQMARGRLFGDIDILVPEHALNDAESELMLKGWVSAKTDAYDQRYYRQWMHEIPPMVHVRRGTVLDVHHTILPRTSRNAPDPAQIIARSVAVPAVPGLRAPSPEDLLIHSITHLMHEGELHNGLRDLHDIDLMIGSFQRQEGFWDRVETAAAGNDLAGPVALGLMLAQSLLGTAVPASVLHTLRERAAGSRSGWPVALFMRALTRDRTVGESWSDRGVQFLVYARAHALRMPLRLVVPHLLRKALMRRPDGTTAATPGPAAR